MCTPLRGLHIAFLVLKHGSPLYCGIFLSLLKANISNEMLAEYTSLKITHADGFGAERITSKTPEEVV